MPLDLIILCVAVAVAGLYSTIESGAMSSWSPWAFRGPIVSARETQIKTAEGRIPDLVPLVEEDDDFSDLRIRIKAVQEDLYLLGIPMNYRSAQDQLPFFAFLSGRLVQDSDAGVLRFQLHLMPGSCLTLMLAIGGKLILWCLNGHYLSATFAFLLFSAFFLGFYVVVYKRRVEDFWFLLTVKLKKLGY